MARFKKGSKEAKAYMAKIRGKKGPVKKAVVPTAKVKSKVKSKVRYSRVSGVSNISQESLNNLRYLLNELETSQKQCAVLKGLSRRKELTDTHTEMYKRYPLYIKSLRRQIIEAKKHIK